MLAAALKRNDRAELDAMLRDLNAPTSLLHELPSPPTPLPLAGEGSFSAGIDFVVLLDPSGKVICRSGTAEKGGRSFGRPPGRQGPPRAKACKRDRGPVPGAIRAEGAALAKRAAIRIIPTEAARPAKDLLRTDGMVAAAAVPVLDAEGQLQAILYGGDSQPSSRDGRCYPARGFSR